MNEHNIVLALKSVGMFDYLYWQFIRPEESNQRLSFLWNFFSLNMSEYLLKFFPQKYCTGRNVEALP